MIRAKFGRLINLELDAIQQGRPHVVIVGLKSGIRLLGTSFQFTQGCTRANGEPYYARTDEAIFDGFITADLNPMKVYTTLNYIEFIAFSDLKHSPYYGVDSLRKQAFADWLKAHGSESGHITI